MNTTQGSGEDSEIKEIEALLENVNDVMGGFECNPLTCLVSDCLAALPSPGSVPSFRADVVEIRWILESLKAVLDDDRIPDCAHIAFLALAHIHLQDKLDWVRQAGESTSKRRSSKELDLD